MPLKSSNFREIHTGTITSNVLYRSAHPISNGRQVDSVILSASNAKIETIINLSDSINTLRSKVAVCPWYVTELGSFQS
jgi:hypothetical protein